jgi:Carboxypeptidase regulatory-like domain/TonB-dependent Receptor Plug Domain
MRFPRFVPFFVCLTLNTFSLFAQSPNGNINGLVSDPSRAAVVGAEIVAVNDVTGVQHTTKTNSEGIYALPNLPPGPYRVQVSRIGFKTLIKPDITLNVQDSLSINFTLLVGAFHEIVTVEGGALIVNTESAAVSTVIDRKYVENMPLNGRSFQDLILLTPGVVTNNPQSPAGNGGSGGGEFSVNGQRTESNVYTVDGVSANIGAAPDSSDRPATSGSVANSTALGTTQSLVSLDALQEFRVQSSTYSAEFGRNPGGQFSFVTRSGSNEWHGSAFDYLRNSVFDANDWFNNYLGQSEPALRQNDFGGTLGGPLRIPFLYDGKDRTFIFFSYEGLRVVQPQASTLSFVPNVYLRKCTPSPLRQVLNAFPQPTSPGSVPDCSSPDPSNGIAQFVGTWSNAGGIDATSIRFDHMVSDKLRLFFRFSDAPSNFIARIATSPSQSTPTSQATRSYTLGATSLLSNSLNNEFRLNYSSNKVEQSDTPDGFGGATPVNLLQMQGFTGGANQQASVFVGLGLGVQFLFLQQSANFGQQRQWNILDTLTWVHGRHQFKFGLDLRRLNPQIHQVSPNSIYDYFSEASILTNNADLAIGSSTAAAFPLYLNFSAFAQDEWKIEPRLNLSIGLRWEVNPAPGAPKGNLPYTTVGTSLSTLALAPQGTSLWNTAWYNFAPRLGVAYVSREGSRFETVFRGGAGVFFDTGQQGGSSAYQGPGVSATLIAAPPDSFPVPVPEIVPPLVNPPVAPYGPGNSYSYPKHLQLPYTLQWNASVQQSLGPSQALTASYVGAAGRRLLEQAQVNVAPFNPNFATVVFTSNGLTSDYDALQVQYQRRLAHGLQALASYTFGHSIDFGSQNYSLPYARGNSDFDVRHSFSTAFSYDLPSHMGSKLGRAVFGDWGLDDRFTARTGFPVTLNGNPVFDPATGKEFNAGLDLVPGQPVYIYGPACAQIYGNGLSCPGGQALNPAAFNPPSGPSVGDAPRNFARGFGAWQMDIALRREFPIYERLKFQFRAEAFNVFNHPNFGTINSFYCSPDPTSPNYSPGCAFGQATATLANSLGGLNSLYQMGGPRSMQFALRLTF